MLSFVRNSCQEQMFSAILRRSRHEKWPTLYIITIACVFLSGSREATGVPSSLQNCVAALYVVGGFDSHMLPPIITSLERRLFYISATNV